MAKPFSKILAKSYCQVIQLQFQGLYLYHGSHQKTDCCFLNIQFRSLATKEWGSNSQNLIFSHARFLGTTVEGNEQFKTYTATTAYVTVSFPSWNKPGLMWVLLGCVSSFVGHCLRSLLLSLFFSPENFCNILYFLIYKLYWILQCFPISMQKTPRQDTNLYWWFFFVFNVYMINVGGITDRLKCHFDAKCWMPLYVGIFIVLMRRLCLTQNANRPQEIQEEHWKFHSFFCLKIVSLGLIQLFLSAQAADS